MPVTFARAGELNTIRRIGGNDVTRRLLQSLGFVVGAAVTVITAVDGHLIVNIKGTRIAISQDVACRIMV